MVKQFQSTTSGGIYYSDYAAYRNYKFTIWYCLPIDYFNDDGEDQYTPNETKPNKYGVKIPVKILGLVRINLALSYDNTHDAFGNIWIGNISESQGNHNQAAYFSDDVWLASYYYRNYIYMVLCAILY